MGKVHRIKRRFSKIVERQPWKMLKPGSSQNFRLPDHLSFYIGKRYDSSVYVGYFGERYKHLMHSLVQEFEARVAHGDKSSVTS